MIYITSCLPCCCLSVCCCCVCVCVCVCVSPTADLLDSETSESAASSSFSSISVSQMYREKQLVELQHVQEHLAATTSKTELTKQRDSIVPLTKEQNESFASSKSNVLIASAASMQAVNLQAEDNSQTAPAPAFHQGSEMSAQSSQVREQEIVPRDEAGATFLWSFGCSLTAGRNVSCMSWSRSNPVRSKLHIVLSICVR